MDVRYRVVYNTKIFLNDRAKGLLKPRVDLGGVPNYLKNDIDFG